ERGGGGGGGPGGGGLGGGVTGGVEHAAQVRDHLRVDVLAGGRVEELPFWPDRDIDLAIVPHGDRADGFQQRQHGPPFDVVTYRVPEDLAQRIAVPVVQVLWLRRRCHGVTSCPDLGGRPAAQQRSVTNRDPSAPPALPTRAPSASHRTARTLCP